MTDSISTGAMSAAGYTGEDFVCRACGCEVMVKHWGEPRSHADSGAFVCHCGQRMEPEHAGSVGRADAARAGDGDRGFDQDDFLGHGGGAPETTDTGATSSAGSGRGDDR